MAKITQALIKRMLEEQKEEFASKFALTPRLLHRVIADFPAFDLLIVGQELIASPEPDKRILGVRLIQETQTHQHEATTSLIGLLDRELDNEVLYWTVAALGFVKSDAATQQLIALADNPNPGIRYHVAGALINRASPHFPEESLQTLRQLSHDDNSEVRFSAVFGLGSLWKLDHDERIESELRQATVDDDQVVARAARDALEDVDGGAVN
jgi:HEAT repeats